MNKGTEELTLNFPQGLAGPLASSPATESQPSMPGAEQHGTFINFIIQLGEVD